MTMADARVEILDSHVVSDDWSTFTKYTILYTRADGTSQILPRETYDRGDGAVILPFDPDRGTVLLGRQFRLTAWLTGHEAPLIEAAAGLLDRADPATRIKAELEEELGLRLTDVRQIWEVFMSPGSVTERLFFFVARYTSADRVSQGGGLVEEGEEIDVLELPLHDALDRVADGRIRDAKTIMLLQYAALHLMPERIRP